MVLKSVFVAAICTAVLALGGVASADEYRPSEFLKLDLPKAVLSPKRLGPDAHFEPVPVEANSGQTNDAQAKAEEPAIVSQPSVRTARVATPAARKVAHVPARAKLARRHTNPLDAEARDIRIQTWPCRSGGICNWR